MDKENTTENYILIREHWFSGEVLSGITWPYRQIDLIVSFIAMCSTGQVRLRGTESPCWAGRLRVVKIVLHFVSRVLQSDSEIMVVNIILWLGMFNRTYIKIFVDVNHLYVHSWIRGQLMSRVLKIKSPYWSHDYRHERYCNSLIFSAAVYRIYQ